MHSKSQLNTFPMTNCHHHSLPDSKNVPLESWPRYRCKKKILQLFSSFFLKNEARKTFFIVFRVTQFFIAFILFSLFHNSLIKGVTPVLKRMLQLWHLWYEIAIKVFYYLPGNERKKLESIIVYLKCNGSYWTLYWEQNLMLKLLNFLWQKCLSYYLKEVKV